MTGKFELEYEGEIKGADHVAREIIRAAVSNVFEVYFPNGDLKAVSRWFDQGGALSLADGAPPDVMLAQAGPVPDRLDVADRAGIAPRAPAPLVAAGSISSSRFFVLPTCDLHRWHLRLHCR